MVDLDFYIIFVSGWPLYLKNQAAFFLISSDAVDRISDFSIRVDLDFDTVVYDLNHPCILICF